MLHPLITLTTDFGETDHFAGVMKGVICGLAPRARIVDITHKIQPFEVSDAAFTIAQAYRYFPEKTIHVVVVDPGVGSARRPLLAEMAGQYFVAPDNGVLSMIYSREKARVRHVTASRYFLEPLSRTFHGRDIFSPVAAQVARGILPAKFGPRIEDYLKLKLDEPVRTGKRVWSGTILKVDRFGNLITNLHVDSFPEVKVRPFELLAGMESLIKLALTFSEGGAGELFAIVGSSGFIEVAANRESASARLKVGAGSPVELTIY